jgi:PLP dependent protein
MNEKNTKMNEIIDIKKNLKEVRETIPTSVTLVCVSKTKPNEYIMEAYESGERVFGENKAQELRQKHETLPKDIQWHFIGHLQENKIKYIIDYVTLIHSVDSLKLLIEINKQALKHSRIVDCLLEIDISHEESKFGLSREEATKLLEDSEYKQLKNIRLCGVMGVGSITTDREQTRKEFRELKELFTFLKTTYFPTADYFKQVSMGMTHDYDIALKEGATIVRIGSKIFGERNYNKE